MKDFGKWHELKGYIEENNGPLMFAEREIWWCSIGLNLGDEEDGKNDHFERPVLVFRKFNKDIFWGLPMSTKIKDDKFHFTYSFSVDFDASILLSQLRLMSSKRLIRRLIKIHPTVFNQIQKSIVSLINLDREKSKDVNESDPTKVESSGA